MHWQRIETHDGREDVFPDHGCEEYHAIHHDLSALSDQERTRGMWDDTMIVFTADHGEMLGDFGLYSKGVMWEQAVPMPFYVYHLDLDAGEREGFAEHVDVFPTVCDYLGVPIPSGVQGRSLRPLLDGGQTPRNWREYTFSQLNDDCMIKTLRWKLVYENGRPVYLFDLQADPEEY